MTMIKAQKAKDQVITCDNNRHKQDPLAMMVNQPVFKMITSRLNGRLNNTQLPKVIIWQRLDFGIRVVS